MTRLEGAHRYDVPVERSVAFITDTANWPSFWPGYVRLEEGSRWGAPGDTARLITRLLGRERELTMTITEFEPDLRTLGLLAVGASITGVALESRSSGAGNRALALGLHGPEWHSTVLLCSSTCPWASGDAVAEETQTRVSLRPPAARETAMSSAQMTSAAATRFGFEWSDAIFDAPRSPYALTDKLGQQEGCGFARDCPDGQCVVGAIEKQRAILGDRTQPLQARREALKFIVHFVGDVHQPMHANNHQDKGGNDYQISLATKLEPEAYAKKHYVDGVMGTNLHSIWDYYVLGEVGVDKPGHPGLGLMGYADRLDALPWPPESGALSEPLA